MLYGLLLRCLMQLNFQLIRHSSLGLFKYIRLGIRHISHSLAGFHCHALGFIQPLCSLIGQLIDEICDLCQLLGHAVDLVVQHLPHCTGHFVCGLCLCISVINGSICLGIGLHDGCFDHRLSVRNLSFSLCIRLAHNGLSLLLSLSSGFFSRIAGFQSQLLCSHLCLCKQSTHIEAGRHGGIPCRLQIIHFILQLLDILLQGSDLLVLLCNGSILGHQLFRLCLQLCRLFSQLAVTLCNLLLHDRIVHIGNSRNRLCRLCSQICLQLFDFLLQCSLYVLELGSILLQLFIFSRQSLIFRSQLAGIPTGILSLILQILLRLPQCSVCCSQIRAKTLDLIFILLRLLLIQSRTRCAFLRFLQLVFECNNFGIQFIHICQNIFLDKAAANFSRAQ